MTPSTKATIVTGMCEGLLHLHLNDIVHQDLKPENIMVSGLSGLAQPLKSRSKQRERHSNKQSKKSQLLLPTSGFILTQ